MVRGRRRRTPAPASRGVYVSDFRTAGGWYRVYSVTSEGILLSERDVPLEDIDASANDLWEELDRVNSLSRSDAVLEFPRHLRVWSD